MLVECKPLSLTLTFTWEISLRLLFNSIELKNTNGKPEQKKAENTRKEETNQKITTDIYCRIVDNILPSNKMCSTGLSPHTPECVPQTEFAYKEEIDTKIGFNL